MHQHVVEEMEAAFLCKVPPDLRPLTSIGMRRQQTTVGTLVCTFLKDGLGCDCALIDAGCIRRNASYPADVENFTYGDLKKEVPFDSEVCVVPIRGSVVAEAVRQSRGLAALDPPQDHGGYLQADRGIVWDEETRQVTHIAGAPVDLDKEYRVAVLAVTLNGMNRNQPLIDWANDNGDKIPPEEMHRPAKEVIVSYSSALIWAYLGEHEQAERGKNGLSHMPSFDHLDKDQSGVIDFDEIKEAVQKLLGGENGVKVPEFVVQNIMHTVDANNDGTIDASEFNAFVLFFQQMNTFNKTMNDCRFRIIFVNDVYELGMFPHLDNLIRANMAPNTITMLPGDFVAPSLLSSLDKGKGMIDMMNRVGGCGIQYVCFGNHENDIPIEALRERIGEFKGEWINSNMPGFTEPALPEYRILEIEAGGQKRKIGIIGLLTIDSNLYRVGAFGGAMETATPVYETAERLKKVLMEEHGCDVVIPMTHQVMAEDREMARLKMGFPLLVAAHDHDPYCEEVEGCWIVKTGCDATQAAVIDLVWADASTPGDRPKVEIQMLNTKDYAPNEELVDVMNGHLRCVVEMESAFLCEVPPGVRLRSTGMRREPTSVGEMVTTLIRQGFRDSYGSTEACHGVMMDAGAIRRNFNYPEEYETFTYGDLKKEVPFDSEMVVVSMEGQLVCDAVRVSRERSFRSPPEDWGGYLQLDDGFKWDPATNQVTHINGEPIVADRLYSVGVLALSLNGMNRNQPLIDYANRHPERVPDLDAVRHAKDVAVYGCSTKVWQQLGSFEDLDQDGNGMLTVEEVQEAMGRVLRRKVSQVAAQNLIDAIDADGSGTVNAEEFYKVMANPQGAVELMRENEEQ
uniref:EF-hand domain-containing protein n=1 Tax=Hemiselmis tepida TaxID=464990 RepID=A0A7S0W998_9CRYP